MLFNVSATKALSLITFLGAAQAAALPRPIDLITSSTTTTTTQLESRIAGNEASSLLCFTVGNKKCGIAVTYTNGQTRQTVRYQTGGTYACAYQALQKHTNDAGFWADLDIFGTAGMHIGFNSKNTEIALGKATSSSNGQQYMNGRCQNEFGFTEGVDTGKSGEAYWGDLEKKLY